MKLGTIKLNLHGIVWTAPTSTVLDQLIDRYMAAVPNANYHAARDYAERIYSTHCPTEGWDADVCPGTPRTLRPSD